MPKSNVRRVNGVEITGTPVAGDIPVATSGTAAAWGTGVGSGVLANAVIRDPSTTSRNRITPTAAAVPSLELFGKGDALDAGATIFNLYGDFSTGGGSAGASLGALVAKRLLASYWAELSLPGGKVTASSATFSSANISNLTISSLTGLTYLAALELGQLTLGKVLVVSATGVINVYSSIGAAITAASSGQLVVVGPGTYNERNLLKNGVNQYYLPGASVVYTGSGNGGIFDDTAYGTGGAVTCTIGGFGTFTNSGSGSSNHVFYLQGSSSTNITFTGQLISSTVADTVITGASLTLSLTCETITGSGTTFGGVLYISAGTVTVHAKTISSTAVGSAAVNASGGTLTLEANAITANNTGATSGSVKIGGGTVYAHAKTITNTGSTAAVYVNGGTGTVSADRITGPTGVKTTGGTVTLTCPQVETSDGSKYALTGTGGTIHLHDARVANTGSNGVAAEINGQTLITYGSCVFVSDTGATDSITAASAQTLTNYGTLSGNKALNANVAIAGAYHAVHFTPGGTVTTAIDYTVPAAVRTVVVTASGKTVTLPSASGVADRAVQVKNLSTGNVTVATVSSQTIDGALTGGATSQTLSSGSSFIFVSDGSNWITT